MSSRIQFRKDQKRGCGWRKPGGLYLINNGQGMPCCKPLTICPACGAGVKFSRGWTWINVQKLFPESRCINQNAFYPLANDALERIGLLWVGESFYETPAAFIEEAERLGISRRISAVPREFKLGETWVAFAHLSAISAMCNACKGFTTIAAPCEECENTGFTHTPGIFRIFKPEAIEYVVTGKESDEELDALINRGITPIAIEHLGETGELIKEE